MSWINPPDCNILDNWVFESLILADEPFVKALRIFETCVSVNSNLCGKLISLNQRLKVTSVPFFYCKF